MKAWTYYEPIADEFGQFAYHALMVHEWRRNWSAKGFDCVVLSARHAQAHPAFRRCMAWSESLRSVNHKAYQAACFVRWLALAQSMRPGEVGMFTDYDVFNVRFGPVQAQEHYAPDHVTNLHFGQCSQPLVLDYRQAQQIPAVLMFSTTAMAKARAEQADWNDMSFWEEDKLGKLGFARYLDVCLPYGPGVDAAMVHLSYEAVAPANRGKLEIWKELEVQHGI